MGSGTKYFKLWKEIWKVSLKHGVCPFRYCDIAQKPCEHLDRFLSYDPSRGHFTPEVFLMGDIEKKVAAPEPEKGQAWELFKKLRRFGLHRDQISILVRKFAFNMSRETIMREMGWGSKKMFDLRYHSALDTLKKRGYR